MSENLTPATAPQSLLDLVPGATSIMDAIKKIDETMAGITPDKSSKTLANLEFPPFGKLKDLTKLEEIINAGASLTQRETAYKDEVVRASRSESAPEFVFVGHSVKKWRACLDKLYEGILNKERIEGLKTIKDIFTKHISKEDEKQADFEKAAKLAKSIPGFTIKTTEII